MSFKNIIDNSSVVVSANTPGVTLDLRNHGTLSRSSVQVRLWVYASNTVSGDSGQVMIVDSTAAPQVTVPITGSTARWYVQDGYMPASLAKYDPWFGGNTAGTLTVMAFSLYELTHPAPYEARLTTTLAAATLSSTGTIATVSYGDMAATLAAATLSGTGEMISVGSLSATLAAATLSSTGTIAAAPPAWQAAGTATYSNTGAALSPGWPTHAANDVALSFHMSEQFFVDPGAATLSTANGFTVIDSMVGNFGTSYVRITVAWHRATGGSMSAPTWAAAGGKTAAVIQTYRGCTTSGNPYDVTSKTGSSASETTVSVGGVTTTVANTLVAIGVASYNTTPGATSHSSWANSDLTSVGEVSDDSDGSNGQAIGTATGVRSATGAYGASTVTLSHANVWAGMTIALQP